MTVNTASTYEFSIGQIVTLAHRQAGILSLYQSPTPQQVVNGCLLLQMISQSAATEGFFAKTVDFYEVPILTGVDAYTLPANVLDVVGTGMYVDPSQVATPPAVTTHANGELPVTMITREQWQNLSSKGAEGPPKMGYSHRPGALIEVRFWPVPDASCNGGIVRLQIHRLRANMTDSTKTPDFERYWVEYLVYELASHLAIGSTLGLDRVTALKGIAAEQLHMAKGMANERPAQRIVSRHRGGRYA